MKRYVVLVLVFVLTLSMMAGCAQSGAKQNENSANSTQSQNQEETKQKGSPTVLSMMIESHASWPYNPDWYVFDLIEEELNIKFDVTTVIGGNYDEKLNITLASGNLPDIIHVMGRPVKINKYGSDGALLDLQPHIDKMPNFKKFLEENPMRHQTYMNADGQLFAFPPGQGAGETNRRGWLYRRDIFEKHNIEIPTTSDELYQVLVKLKELYPESYPYTWRGGLSTQIEMFTRLWGSGYKAYFDHDAKEWKYGPVEDDFKEMVMYVNKLYKEGLIPPDILTLDTGAWQNLVSTDKVFITTDYLTRIDTFNNTMRQENPEFTIAYMPPVACGPNGERKFTYSTIVSNALAVSATNKNLDATFKLFDFYYSDEGIDLLSWGREGETYDVVNGKRTFRDCEAISDIRNKYGLTTYGTYTTFDYDSHMSTFSKELTEAYVEAKQYDMLEDPEPSFTEAEYEEFVHIDEALKKHKEENVAKFFIGTRDLSDWDNYVKEAMDLGVERYLELHNKAYKRTQELLNK